MLLGLAVTSIILAELVKNSKTVVFLNLVQTSDLFYELLICPTIIQNMA